MKVGIYPGSFDPITNGHIDIIERAAKIVDKLIIAVLVNPNKNNSLFDKDERINMILEATLHLDNVEVETFDGLLVDFAKLKGATIIIRGLRNNSDFESEMNMAHMNRCLLEGLETVFLVTSPEYSYISSSAVKEVVKFNGKYDKFVPNSVIKALQNRMGEK